MDPMMQAFLDALQGRDAAKLAALLAPTFNGQTNGRHLDAAGQVAFAQGFWEGFPDGQFTFEATGGAGRHVVIWSFAGTHTGTYTGIPGTGKAVKFNGYCSTVNDKASVSMVDWRWDPKVFLKAILEPEIVLAPLKPDPVRNYEHMIPYELRRGFGGPRKKKGKDGKDGKGDGRPGQGGQRRGRGPKPTPGAPGGEPVAGDAPSAPADPNAPAVPVDPNAPAGKRRRRRGRGRGPREGTPGEGAAPAGADAPAPAAPETGGPAPDSAPQAPPS